jgi:formylmethanofuran dehydrogenase subunit E
LDHNISVKRSNKIYEYKIGDKVHHYHPDFEVNNQLIEIKGYHNDLVDIKLNSTNNQVKILYKEDLQYCFDYVRVKYNKTEEHLKELYDDYKPKYEYKCDYCGKIFTRDQNIKTQLKFCCRQCAGKYMRSINFKNN